MSLYKINKGFITQKLGDKTVIFDGEESVLYTFNETASFVFGKIKKRLSDKQIIESLIKKFGITQKRAEKDFKDLATNLLAKKIIAQITE